MAFSTQRGRPRKSLCLDDAGTPELRLKHALGLTAEPIDLCLEKQLISPEQHRSGLHLRWLYTLRYGAPTVTTRYADKDATPPPTPQDATWRAMRESEYNDAVAVLKQNARYECVMRLCIFNEHPSFLNPALRSRALSQPLLAEQLAKSQRFLRDGLELLVFQWKKHPA